MSARERFVRFLAVVAILLACVPESGHAQAGRSQVEEGNRLYEEGRFPEAHEKYLEGLAAAPESGLIRFNDGNALYKGEDYPRAVEAYERAIGTGDPALIGSAWYNLGNAFYRECVRRQLYLNGGGKIHLAKNPLWAGRVASLLESFPDARFVVNLRDPRDTIPSLLKLVKSGWKQMGWEEERHILSMWTVRLSSEVGSSMSPLFAGGYTRLIPERGKYVGIMW